MVAKSWSGPASGTWGNTLDWTPTGLPGLGDDLTLAGSLQISGSGVSNSLTVTGAGAALSGAYVAGTLNVGTASTAGALTLAGASLTATAANLLFGPLTVSGTGTKLTVTGQLALGGTRAGARATANPLLHYEQYGWKEGRDPSAQFSTAKYLAAYSDVQQSGMNPLLHYVLYGQNEGRTAFQV